MRFSLKHILVGTVVLVFANAAAYASTITQTVQFGPGLADYNSSPGTPATFSYFDSNLGALNSVTLGSTYQFNSTITLISFAASSGTVRTQSAAQFGSNDGAITKVLNTAVNNLVSPVDGTSVTSGGQSLSPIAYDIYGSAKIYSQGAGMVNQYQSAGSGSTGPFTDSNASDLSAFFRPGGGNYSLLLNTLTSAILTQSGGSASALALTTASGSLTVSYNYTSAIPPVAVTPEPSSILLLGTGVLGLLGVARRRLA